MLGFSIVDLVEVLQSDPNLRPFGASARRLMLWKRDASSPG